MARNAGVLRGVQEINVVGRGEGGDDKEGRGKRGTP